MNDYKIRFGVDVGKTLEELGKERVAEKYRSLIKLCADKKSIDLPQPTREFMQAAEKWLDGIDHTK